MAYDAALGYDPNDIAKSINEASARGDDAETKRLILARWNDKVSKDPALVEKYGNDMYSTIAKGYLAREQQTPVQQTQQVTNSSTTPSFDATMKWIDALQQQQKASAVAGLENAKTKSLASLEAERAGIAPQYAANRSSINTAAELERQRLNESMAVGGLAGSGAQGELQTRLAVGAQGSMSAQSIAEANALADVLRRQTGVEQDYQTGLQQANSAAEAAKYQALIDQAQQQRNYELQAAGYTGMLGGQQTIQGASAAREAAAEQTSANDAALQRQLDTIGQYSSDYAAEANRRQTSTDTTDDALIPYLRAASNAKAAAMQSAQSTQQQEVYKQATDMFKQLGVANGWIATALGIPEGATTADYQKILYDVSKPYYSPNTGGGSSGASLTENQRVNALMDVWKARGTAPKGLEAYGVTEGMSIYNKPASLDMTKTGTAQNEIESLMKITRDSEGNVVSASGGALAYNRLNQMVDNGEIDESTADMIAESIPQLKKYIEEEVLKTQQWGYSTGR
jgi:hypothetical protein